MARASAEYEKNVFINCPFDRDYKPLFEATVFAVQISGFKPRCALEASNAGEARLEKIMAIVAECKYGIHDLSRTELGPNGLPRFNMPLELGIDLGCRRFGDGSQRTKKLLVMDRARHRYQKFISDIAGQDILHHSRRPREVIRNVRDWLATESKSATIPGGAYMFRRYQLFQDSLLILCRRQKLNINQVTFGDLSGMIRIWLEENET